MPARPSYDARLPYATVSGHEIHLEVYLPKDKQGPVPVLAWFHGGGWYDGAAGDFADLQLFPCLARGWAFVSAEYRLAPQVTMDDISEDVERACAFIQDGSLDKALGGGKVDGRKFALSGASAGGALALCAAYQLKSPPLAVFGLYPAIDLTHESFTTPAKMPYTIEYDEVKEHIDPNGPIVSSAPAQVNFATLTAEARTRACFYCLQEGKSMLWATKSKDLEEARQKAAKYSAKFHASASSPPTVIVHGTADPMVLCDLSAELVEDLKQKGVDALMVTVPDESHGFDLLPGAYDNPKLREPTEKAHDFLAKYLDSR